MEPRYTPRAPREDSGIRGAVTFLPLPQYSAEREGYVSTSRILLTLGGRTAKLKMSRRELPCPALVIRNALSRVFGPYFEDAIMPLVIRGAIAPFAFLLAGLLPPESSAQPSTVEIT